jgi:hypothetical protein
MALASAPLHDSGAKWIWDPVPDQKARSAAIENDPPSGKIGGLWLTAADRQENASHCPATVVVRRWRGGTLRPDGCCGARLVGATDHRPQGGETFDMQHFRTGRFGRVFRSFLLAAGTLALLSGCGEEAEPKASTAKDAVTDSGTTDQPADVAQADIGKPSAIETLALSVTVKVKDPLSGSEIESKLAGLEIHPLDCTESAPCPLLFVVGDRAEGAFPAYKNGAEELAKALKVGVIIFNLPGQGSGSNKSNGPDDIGGSVQEAAINQVVKLKQVKGWVDKSKIGFLTIGSGLWAFARAYKVFSQAALSNIGFLIDVEGPVDRCGLSQTPADEAAGIGPGDGPGATESACHFDFYPQSAQYPAAQNGKPAAIVCATAAYPILGDAEKGCDKQSFWASREPFNNLKDARFRYQRLQLTYDHAQPGYWQSRLAIKAIASSKAPYYALNNMQACSSPLTDEECDGLPCWLNGGFGNGLPPAPYAGSDWVQVSPDALMTQVIPGYLLRMLDKTAAPNCQ